MNKNIIFYCLIFLIFGFQLSKAQKTKVYDSLVFFNNNPYQANYDYYIHNGDTVYHGPYALTKQIEEISNENGYNFSAINGNFVRNIADGNWVIRQGNFSPSGKGAFKDLTYSFKIDGNEFIAKGRFDNGIKNTPWELYEWNISNSNIKDTIFSAKLPFRENNFYGEFKVSYQGEYLVGHIDKNQFTDKRWALYVTDPKGNKVLIKEWVFFDNELINTVMHENGKMLTMEISQSTGKEKILEEIVFNENYLNIIDIKASLNNPELFAKYIGKEKIRDLFFMITERFHVLDSMFNPITDVKISPKIKTRIEKFPISEVEHSILTMASSKTNIADSIINAIIADPQVNLALLSNKKMASYVAILQTLDDQYLKINKMIVKHYQRGNLEYIYRNRFIENTINTTNKIEVPLIFDQDTSYFPYEVALNKIENDDPIRQFASLADDILKEVRLFNDSIGMYVQEIKQEESLSVIEAALYRKYEEVKNLSDSLLNVQHDNFAGFDVKQELDGFVEKLLKNYTSLGTTEEKLAHVYPTLQCLNRVESLIIQIEKAPEGVSRVRDAYTNRVFNPYTFTYMEETMKQSIFRSFNEVIIPGIFGNLRNLNCDNIQLYSDNFNNLFDDMIRVLTQSTRREERRIRRAKNAQKAAEILGLNLNF